MWSADVATLSDDGWQPNEDGVVMRSQRLMTNVSPDTVEQCRRSVTVSPAKTAEPIEMPFGLWARMGPENHGIMCQMGFQILHGKGQFGGKGQPIVKYRDFLP